MYIQITFLFTVKRNVHSDNFLIHSKENVHSDNFLILSKEKCATYFHLPFWLKIAKISPEDDPS